VWNHVTSNTCKSLPTYLLSYVGEDRIPKYPSFDIICVKQRRRIPKVITFEVPLLEVLNQPICNIGAQVMELEVKIEARITEAACALFTKCSCK